MAKSTKPRKKKTNGKLKKLKREIDQVTENSLFMNIHGLLISGDYWMLNGRMVPTELVGKMKEEYHLFFMTAHKWNVLGGVACRSQDGQAYIRFTQCDIRNEVGLFEPELQNFAFELIQENLEKINKDHLLTTFCIFAPDCREFTVGYLDKLLKHAGVFERLVSPYELQQLEQKTKAEIESVAFDDVLPKYEANLLKPHFANFWQIYQAEQGSLRKIKGIGEKREHSICSTFINYFAKHSEAFRDFVIHRDNINKVPQFLEQSFKANQEMYERYLKLDGVIRHRLKKRKPFKL